MCTRKEGRKPQMTEGSPDPVGFAPRLSHENNLIGTGTLPLNVFFEHNHQQHHHHNHKYNNNHHNHRPGLLHSIAGHISLFQTLTSKTSDEQY